MRDFRTPILNGTFISKLPFPSGKTLEAAEGESREMGKSAVDETQPVHTRPVHTAATGTCTKPTQNPASEHSHVEWRLHSQLRSYWQLMASGKRKVHFLKG